ncbi:hypothetical protein NL676_037999 [Syzygium grande]|nr:hypothetical protein NL676_037999 [Syzygium grande]
MRRTTSTPSSLPCRPIGRTMQPACRGPSTGDCSPRRRIHVVHSAHALPWLGKLPEELLDANSPAYNKGRVYYIGAPGQVIDAYAAQFAKDTAMFLSALGKEAVSGGIMVLLMPGRANGIAHSCVLSDVMFDLLGLCLMDMAKEGKTSEALVDSFNVPVYTPSPEEMTASETGVDGLAAAHACMLHLRAGVEGLVSKHFGSKIVDELFDRFLEKEGQGIIRPYKFGLYSRMPTSRCAKA